jgi:hypothetical protein
MEPESSSTYQQVPATCPYPEPTPSSPYDPTVKFTKDNICFSISYMFRPNVIIIRLHAAICQRRSYKKENVNTIILCKSLLYGENSHQEITL